MVESFTFLVFTFPKCALCVPTSVSDSQKEMYPRRKRHRSRGLSVSGKYLDVMFRCVCLVPYTKEKCSSELLNPSIKPTATHLFSLLIHVFSLVRIPLPRLKKPRLNLCIIIIMIIISKLKVLYIID